MIQTGRKTKSRKRLRAFTAQIRFSAGAPAGILYSIALHLRDSPAGLSRRPSEESAAAVLHFGDVPFRLLRKAASEQERTDEPRASILAAMIRDGAFFVKRPEPFSPILYKNTKNMQKICML